MKIDDLNDEDDIHGTPHEQVLIEDIVSECTIDGKLKYVTFHIWRYIVYLYLV